LTASRGRLAGHHQFHHQSLRAVRAGRVLAVDDLAALVLQPGHRPRPPLPRPAAVERLTEQDDLLAVELVLAPPQRHPGGPAVRPDAGEQPGRRLEPDDAGPGRLAGRAVERELGPQEPAVVDHLLPALAGGLGWLAL